MTHFLPDEDKKRIVIKVEDMIGQGLQGAISL